MYHVKGTYANGTSDTYHANTYKQVVAHIARMMPFGWKYYGDKYVKIVIESGKKKS